MKPRLAFFSFVVATLFWVLLPTAVASTTWYVNGVNGNDNNDCKSPTTACKTIGHAISPASSGDTISVAAATYTENLTITISLKLIGSGASTTIIDGGAVNTVLAISSATANVFLSKFTIRNGKAPIFSTGGGISNSGNLTISNCAVSGNSAAVGGGGGISNSGTLTIKNSTISGNSVVESLVPHGGGISNGGSMSINNSSITGNTLTGELQQAFGGGIDNGGTLTINNSTLSGNTVSMSLSACDSANGGGISNSGSLTINNSTLSGNSAVSTEGDLCGVPSNGGGLYLASFAKTIINNSTLSGNYAGGRYGGSGGGISGQATLQNSIVANSTAGGNCAGTMTSLGYNLSSDNTCNFTGPGDANNTDPMLGPLQKNGGPTQTQALLSGSPAIDAGNASGCTDGNGHLLKTDQRGVPRPDKEDSGGCDMGAYEKQTDIGTSGGPPSSNQDEAEVLSERRILGGLADTLTYHGNCEVNAFGKLTGSCLDGNVPPYHFCRLGSSASCPRGKRAIQETVVPCSGIPDRVDLARKCSF